MEAWVVCMKCCVYEWLRVYMCLLLCVHCVCVCAHALCVYVCISVRTTCVLQCMYMNVCWECTLCVPVHVFM